MYITLIIFWIGFLLDGKNIISHTSKFLLLESYKSVDLRGPTFKSINEGFLKFIVTFPLSRFLVSGFFGREVGFRGALCSISSGLYVVLAQSILSAVTFPLSRFQGFPAKSDGGKARGSLRFYSTLGRNTVKQLHPFFVTGLADGESTFYLGISKSSCYNVGWRIIPSFSIELHSKDLELLGRIQTFFSVGRIKVRSRDGHVVYYVSSIGELTNVIIPHFDKYPLATQKRKDYELFKLALDVLKSKKHTTFEGLNQLVAIKSVMNKGLSRLCLLSSTKKVINLN